MLLLDDAEITTEPELPGFSRSPHAENRKMPQVKTLQEMEKEYILSVLEQCNFKIAGKGGAAELLNLPLTTLHSKMKKLGIKIKYE